MPDYFAPLPYGATSTDPRVAPKGPVPWSWPRPGTGVSWGYQRSASHKHQGVDLFVDVATPVFAVADGTVVHLNKRMPSPPRATGPGWYIVIRHDAENRYSRYLHLSDRVVSEGEHVRAGELIGHSGDTLLEGQRMQSPPHLHFEILSAWPMGSEPAGGSVLSSLDPVSWAASHKLKGAVAPPSSGGILLIAGIAAALYLMRRR